MKTIYLCTVLKNNTVFVQKMTHRLSFFHGVGGIATKEFGVIQ